MNLFLVSWLILFLELACIRWFPAHVLFLTFFTNVVLLACFVGMSIGCILGDHPTRHIRFTPIWLALAVVSALGILASSSWLNEHLDVAGQSNPDVVFFGTEASVHQNVDFKVPIELMMAYFFVLISMIMVGPGQELGRAFSAIPSRSMSYSINLFGSFIGILTFAICSFFELPPIVWFSLSALVIAYLVSQAFRTKDTLTQNSPTSLSGAIGILAIATLGTSGISSAFTAKADSTTYWSPYYRIDYFEKSQGIVTNLIGHQIIQTREQPILEPYPIPHLLRKAIQDDQNKPVWPEFKRILIIGAGSGNDLSRALQWTGKDTTIDAVEIDPVIQKLGSQYHPDKPYADPRVTVHLNDGRNFLRKAPDQEYDVVIFALVDSLVLHSGYSNLRLESFLFTKESFQDIRRVLKPTGVAAIYNFFRQGWIAIRLRDMLRATFHAEPIAFTDPPMPEIRADFFDQDMFTMFFAGNAEQIEPMRKAFEQRHYELAKDKAVSPESPGRFVPKSQEKTSKNVVQFYPAQIQPSSEAARIATDDWPFLYSKDPAIPAITIRGIAIILFLSTCLWFLVSHNNHKTAGHVIQTREWNLALRSLCLGIGFMLIETKAVVEMALLFGSTWLVNTIVFASVLLMSLMGNLYASWARPKNLYPYYIGLFLAIAVHYFVPLDTFLGMNPIVQTVLSCLISFAPILFAGVIFATTFSRSQQPGLLIGTNVAGALIGGLTENASMLLGFRHLLLVAAGFYLLSAIFGNKQQPASTSSGGLGADQ